MQVSLGALDLSFRRQRFTVSPAADAAVATSAALNVTEPSCCGIGG
jgi:hypothetical protein